MRAELAGDAAERGVARLLERRRQHLAEACDDGDGVAHEHLHAVAAVSAVSAASRTSACSPAECCGRCVRRWRPCGDVKPRGLAASLSREHDTTSWTSAPGAPEGSAARAHHVDAAREPLVLDAAHEFAHLLRVHGPPARGRRLHRRHHRLAVGTLLLEYLREHAWRPSAGACPSRQCRPCRRLNSSTSVTVRQQASLHWREAQWPQRHETFMRNPRA